MEGNELQEAIAKTDALFAVARPVDSSLSPFAAVKRTTGRPFRTPVLKSGRSVAVPWVALLPFPDRSAQTATLFPFAAGVVPAVLE
jgi:hypothetical protein